MSIKYLMLLSTMLTLAYSYSLHHLADLQRKKAIPEEVADVYSPERYKKYQAYITDLHAVAPWRRCLTVLRRLAVLFLFPYAWVEHACGGNPYAIFAVTTSSLTVFNTILNLPLSYYKIFVINERYGKNRRTLKTFFRDKIRSTAHSLLFSNVSGMCLVFIGEHLELWTGGFTIGWRKALLIAMVIDAALFGKSVVLGCVSLFFRRMRNTFSPLPDGPLKDKIMALQEGCRKKVHRIFVYDESKRSTSKNAYYLRFLWRREFCIADNFVNENSERELLAVLSHEVGHLKNRFELLNCLDYALSAMFFALSVALIVNPSPVLLLNSWVRQSFGITVNNYVALRLAFDLFFKPIRFLLGIYGAWRSRRKEYAADREAVRQGYGDELIATFKRMSRDQLKTVNPHWLIEFLEFGHPGMYRRIKAIREAQIQMAAGKDI